MTKDIKSESISVSVGNTKMGSIPSISMPPCAACRKDAPCKKDCYAQKAYKMYKQTRAAWNRNYKLAKGDVSRVDYFTQINMWLCDNQPKFFRWHVAGDILDQHYFDCMCRVAVGNPQIKFLCFTKMYHLDFSLRPSDLTVVFSIWPGWSAKGIFKQMPKAYVIDPETPAQQLPKRVKVCPGNCETCGACWSLKDTDSVAFHKH